jgi:hypothetical protein
MLASTVSMGMTRSETGAAVIVARTCAQIRIDRVAVIDIVARTASMVKSSKLHLVRTE